MFSEHPQIGYIDRQAREPVGSAYHSPWAGWIGFACVVMVMMGAFNMIEGLVGVLGDNFYVVAPEDVLAFDLTGWGWIQLVIGALVLVSGLALITGRAWARVVAVVLAILNAIGQLAFVSVYPVWSVIVIALCVVVMWAVIVHGNELTES